MSLIAAICSLSDASVCATLCCEPRYCSSDLADLLQRLAGHVLRGELFQQRVGQHVLPGLAANFDLFDDAARVQLPQSLHLGGQLRTLGKVGDHALEFLLRVEVSFLLQEQPHDLQALVEILGVDRVRQDGVQRFARIELVASRWSMISGVFFDVTRPSTLQNSGVISVIPWITSSGPLLVSIVNVRRPDSSKGLILMIGPTRLTLEPVRRHDLPHRDPLADLAGVDLVDLEHLRRGNKDPLQIVVDQRDRGRLVGARRKRIVGQLGDLADAALQSAAVLEQDRRAADIRGAPPGKRPATTRAIVAEPGPKTTVFGALEVNGNTDLPCALPQALFCRLTFESQSPER